MRAQRADATTSGEFAPSSAKMEAMTTLLIADDEEDMLLLLRVVIRVANDGLEVIGEARSGREAVDRFVADTSGFDVVVLDNRMPTLSGLEAAAEILRARPDQAIVLYSAHLDDQVRAEASALGVRVCLHKNEIETLPDVIRTLAA